MPFLPYKGFALTGRLKTGKCECLWSSAHCQVQMFVNTILQQLKPSTLYMMFQLTLIFYPHHTGMRSEMLYTNGLFEICQERMFVKQRWKHGWSSYLLPKKIFMLKQKSSNLYMIGFKSERKFEWLFIHITLETAPNEMQCDETNSHMVTAGQSYFDLISGYSRLIIFRSILGYSRSITFWSYCGLQQADLISGYSRPIIFQSYFRLQQADLILGYSRPILFWVTAGRSYFNLILGYSRPILGQSHMPILFRVIAGRSYFRTRRNTCMTVGKTTMAAGKINYSCLKCSTDHTVCQITL